MTSINDSGMRLRTITLKDGAARQMQFTDGLMNLVSGLGTGRDQQSYAGYRVMQIGKHQADASYRSSGISRKVHDIIPNDAIRAGWRYKAPDADITAIEAEERRLWVNLKLRKALLLSRLYGGAIIYMGIGNDDPETPLDVNKVQKGDLKYLHVLSRWQVGVGELELDPGSEFYQEPKYYTLNGQAGGLKIHPSRVIRFVNSDISEEMTISAGGWSDPLLTSLWGALVNSDTVQAAFATLPNKAKTDTVTIPGLAEIFATQEGEDRFKERTLAAAMFESMFGTKLLGSSREKDGPAEKWETRQINWAGMPELMSAFLQVVASVSDIPYTRLAGMSPGGLNATGESDDANYQTVIKSLQDLSLRPRHERLNEVLYRSALGSRPASIWLEYSPLFVESDKEKSENALRRAQASQIYLDTGAVPVEVMQVGIKSQLIETGEYPGIEQAYKDYDAGTLEPIIEEPEETPDDPLIAVDPVTGAPTMNRESRLFAANDAAVAAFLSMGYNAAEAVRLCDATPRTAYVSRPVLNTDELQEWATKQGLGQLQDNLHVTIYATWDAFDWMRIEGDWNQNDNGEITIPAGGVRIVEPLGEKCTVCLFTSSQLSWRHESIKRSSETNYTHQQYQPHWSLFKKRVDLTGVEAYQGRIVLGAEKWEEFKL